LEEGIKIKLGNHKIHVVPTIVFYKNYYAKNRIVVNQGSTGSSKTYSIIQNEIINILNKPKGYITSITSPTMPHLRKGALWDFQQIMLSWGLYDEKCHHKTEQYYRFPKGAKMEFFALDDASKARGPRRNRLYINEGNLVDYEIFKQLNQRTKEKITVDYNPSDVQHWIYDKVITRDDAKLIISTYKDNTYLSEGERQEIEHMCPVYKLSDGSELKDEDLSFTNKGTNGAYLVSGNVNDWRVFGLGRRGISMENIYTAYEQVDEIPKDCEIVYGVDFGFNAPTGVVKVAYDEYTNNLYWQEVLYQRGLTNSELMSKLEGLIPDRNDYIYADSAEPARIDEFYKNGWNMHSSDKSVKDGIDFVKSCNLKIVGDSPNLLKELRGYRWKQDKMGNMLDEPIKKGDHSLDGARYASYTHFGHSRKIGFFAA
jgi:phage terminase large subunit